MSETEVSKNIIKTRDDHEPIEFEYIPDNKFKLAKTFPVCTWLQDSEQEFTVKELRTRIEPWLTSLFQSEHLSLLIGSGLTHAVHFIATKDKIAAAMKRAEFTAFKEKINMEAQNMAQKTGRTKANFEDDIRVANELLRGLEIFISTNNESETMTNETTKLKKEITDVLESFAKSILQNESNIANAKSEKRETAFNILVNFLMSFASRTGTRDRLNIFTTNYDRLIEAGAEFAGLHLLDRFVGNLTPIFRSSRLDLDMHYNPPGIRGEPRYLEGVARYTKLHGSIDWVQAGKDIRRIGLPFGAESVEAYLKAPGLNGATVHELMIYPNSAKDQETALYPYIELFRDFAAAACRPNSTLITYGYSFGDEHINRIIRDMLTIPSTHLVIISFNDPLGRIMDTYKELGKPSQITLLIGKHLGDLKVLVDNYLPKSAIDRTTSRMCELLKSRMGEPPENKKDVSKIDNPKDYLPQKKESDF